MVHGPFLVFVKRLFSSRPCPGGGARARRRRVSLTNGRQGLRLELGAVLEYSAFVLQLLLKLPDIDVLDRLIRGDGQRGGDTRGVAEDHVLGLHSHARVSDMARGKADGY